MGYSYKQSVEIFGQEKADTLFDMNNIPKGRELKAKPTEEIDDATYLKMNEYKHGKVLHKRLVKKEFAHTHIGNESGQMGTKNIVIMMAKKKAQGVSKGYPDYHIIIEGADVNTSIHIELKKARGPKGGLNGSQVTDEQIAWIERLDKVVGGYAQICHGYKEATAYIDKIVAKI